MRKGAKGMAAKRNGMDVGKSGTEGEEIVSKGETERRESNPRR